MKVSCIISLSLLGSWNVFAQGTLLFQNIGPGLNAPVFNGLTWQRFSGESFKVDLLVGHTASSLAPVATTSFSSLPNAAGYFLGGVVTLPGHAGGTSPFVQVRLWDSTTGVSYNAATFKGTSVVFQLGARLGDPDAIPPTTPPALVGLTSFSVPLDPEPSTLILTIAGGVTLLLCRRQRASS